MSLTISCCVASEQVNIARLATTTPGSCSTARDDLVHVDVVGDVAAALADVDADAALAHAVHLRSLEMCGGLRHGRAGMKDRLGYVPGARRGAGHEHAGDARACGVDVLVGLVHVVVVVESKLLDLEQTAGVAVGLYADGQHDEVILGLGDHAAVVDVLVAQDRGSARRSR